MSEGESVDMVLVKALKDLLSNSNFDSKKMKFGMSTCIRKIGKRLADKC